MRALGTAFLITALFFIGYLVFNDYKSGFLVVAPNTQLAAISGGGSGLVAHYTFDDGTAADSSGNGHDGALVGGPSAASGRIGQALSFDGTDDYVVLSSSLPTLDDFTISGWMNSSFGHTNSALWAVDGNVHRILIRASRETAFINSVATAAYVGPNTNEWVHFAITRDGGNITIYRNGTSVATGSSGTASVPFASSMLGTDNDSYFGNSVTGSLDDVRIYSRALSPSEIQELYAYTGSGGEEPPPAEDPEDSTNGSCGSSVNTCSSGTLSDTSDTTTQYRWQCEGSNGGSTDSCTSPIPEEADTTPPVISNIRAQGTDSDSTTITWTTDEDSDTTVDYGPTASYGLTSSSAFLSTSHSRSLSNLSPATTYHYRVRSTDDAGNVSQSDDQTFTTEGAAAPVSGDCSAADILCVDDTAGSTQEYSTVQACANAVQAGGTCLIYPGTYSERVTVPRSGTASNRIRFVGASGSAKPTVGGFDISTGNHYITIENLRLTGNIRCNPSRIQPCNWIEVIDNDFDNMSLGVQILGNDVLVSGNTFNNMRDDMVRQHGSRWVVRNNTVVDESDINDEHMDFWQSFCGLSGQYAAQFANIENNTYVNVSGGNVHFSLINATTACNQPPTNLINRYNKIRNIGSGAMSIDTNQQTSGGRDNVAYNNTYAELIGGNAPSWSDYSPVVYTGAANSGFVNNLFYNAMDHVGASGGIGGSGFFQSYNLYYDPDYTMTFSRGASSEVGAVKNQNPQFESTTGTNFALRSTSPAINAGGPLTRVASADNGSGTSLVVEKAYFFVPGWAGTEPDCIAVGSTSNIACISSINYDTNTITLSSSLSRNDNDPVYLYSDSDGTRVLYGSAPDIGAYEYPSSGGSAPAPVSGSCGSVQNACVSGTLSDTADTASEYRWQCTGSNGGTTASCSLAIAQTPAPTNGSCGSTLNSCSSGTLSNIADSDTEYLWQCLGAHGGTSAQCSLDIPTYTLSVAKTGTGQGTVTGAGISCGADCSQPFTTGSSVTLSASPSSGSAFQGWGGVCSGTGSCTVSMTAARTVTAIFNATAPDPDPIDASCGSTENSCLTGSLDDTSDSSREYRWQCRGQNGGRSASCSADKPASPSTGSSGSSGGGGGGGSRTGVVRSMPIATPALLPSVSAPVTAAGGSSFTRRLDPGTSHSDVLRLQRALNALGYTVSASGPGSPGNETSYYGPATTLALQKFQCAVLSICQGSPFTNGYGNFGPSTRAALQARLGGSSYVPPVTVTTPALPSPQASSALARTLYRGSQGEDVRTLQKLLNGRGYVIAVSGPGSPGNETTLFGPATEAALRRFQCAEMQICSGTVQTTGYGLAGQRTRAALQN